MAPPTTEIPIAAVIHFCDGKYSIAVKLTVAAQAEVSAPRIKCIWSFVPEATNSSFRDEKCDPINNAKKAMAPPTSAAVTENPESSCSANEGNFAANKAQTLVIAIA